jgi:hypothetical protein
MGYRHRFRKESIVIAFHFIEQGGFRFEEPAIASLPSLCRPVRSLSADAHQNLYHTAKFDHAASAPGFASVFSGRSITIRYALARLLQSLRE